MGSSQLSDRAAISELQIFNKLPEYISQCRRETGTFSTKSTRSPIGAQKAGFVSNRESRVHDNSPFGVSGRCLASREADWSPRGNSGGKHAQPSFKENAAISSTRGGQVRGTGGPLGSAQTCVFTSLVERLM